MTTDAALIEKRDELKRRLAAGEYKTLVDVLLERTSRLIQKITSRPSPISPWYGSTILYLVIQLLGFALLILLGDTSAFSGESPINMAGPILVSLSVGYLSVPGIVVGNVYIHYVFDTFHNSVLDNTESIATINDFERWLMSVCNRKIHLIASIIGGVPVGIFLIYAYPSIGIIPMEGSFINLSIALTILLLSIGNFMFLYLLLHMVIFSARIGRYDLKLYIANPASSEVIRILAGLLNHFVYLVAISGAYFTLITALSGSPMSQFIVLWIPLLWIPIIAMFILYQSSLSSIIQRAKRKTLNNISTKVERLHATKNLGEKATMDTINRLMDYYDRIEGTRSSAFNSGAVLNLINSLLLPLMALVLANLDRILDLFR